MRILKFIAATTLLCCAIAGRAGADEPLADVPARVGRLALVLGEVRVRSLDTNAVQPAPLNWPVSAHQLFTTADNSAAEIRIGANTLRIAADSALEVSELDDGQLTLFLYYGSASAHLTDPVLAQQFLLRTPQGRISLSGTAVVRIDTQRAGDTSELKVWQGAARFDGSGASVPVAAGRQIEIGEHGINTRTAQADPFDEWGFERDRMLARAGSTSRYLSPDVTGFEELDRYGAWRNDSQYGMLWFPRDVAADWTPYRDGSWIWLAPWGWTWIDQAPWGYAPSHYGRWLRIGRRWCWSPGARTAPAVWAPALVGWVDRRGPHETPAGPPDRHHFGAALGWFPLGARDVYRPPYPVSEARLRALNAGHLPHADLHAALPPVPATRRGEHSPVSVLTTPLPAPLPAGPHAPASVPVLSAPPVLHHPAPAVQPVVQPAIEPGRAHTTPLAPNPAQPLQVQPTFVPHHLVPQAPPPDPVRAARAEHGPERRPDSGPHGEHHALPENAMPAVHAAAPAPQPAAAAGRNSTPAPAAAPKVGERKPNSE